MEILVGKTAGFCYGVKRAVDGAKNEIENSKDHVYCLGEIVHNKQVINDLEEQGIKFIENIEDAKGTTIIRAHGVPKEIYEDAKKKNIELKDYTCPNVLRIHKIVEDYSQKGYFVFLCGSSKHPENLGTISHCNKNSYIIEKEDDTFKALEKLEKEGKGLFIYNLGTGKGYSVLDMVKAFEKSTGKKVAYKIAPRRAGDIATCYSDPQKAKNELYWEATKTLNDMCKDSWKYIQNRKK